MQCDVFGGVLYISNESKKVRYARAVNTNLYNFKS